MDQNTLTAITAFAAAIVGSILTFVVQVLNSKGFIKILERKPSNLATESAALITKLIEDHAKRTSDLEAKLVKLQEELNQTKRELEETRLQLRGAFMREQDCAKRVQHLEELIIKTKE